MGQALEIMREIIGHRQLEHHVEDKLKGQSHEIACQLYRRSDHLLKTDNRLQTARASSGKVKVNLMGQSLEIVIQIFVYRQLEHQVEKLRKI
jgi:hypothetical protein